MKVRDAALKVLSEASGPLHVEQITEKMLSQRLWETAGKTPSATVAATLYSHIKNNPESSPFILVAPQTFYLRPGYESVVPIQVIPGNATSATRTRAGHKTYSFTDLSLIHISEPTRL